MDLMPMLYGYVRNMVLFMAFGSFISIILPNTKYKGYVQLVLGLTLIIMLLQPLGQLMRGLENTLSAGVVQVDEPADSFMNPAVSPDSDPRRAMITNEVNARLQEQIGRMVESQGNYTLTDVQAALSDDCTALTGLRLTLAKAAGEAKQNTPLIRIDPVSVRIGGGSAEDNPDDSTDPEIIALKNSLSDFYHLPAEHIHISNRP